MRIGIYGGSFNPPHAGHLRAAVYAVDALHLDKLLLIPAGIAPHKELPPFSPTAEQRLEMMRLAAAETGDSRIVVSDLEVRREGKSYTWETVQTIREQHPNAELFLLMGTDMFLSFDRWVNPDRIAKEATLAVFYRGEPDEKKLLTEKRQQMPDARVEWIENPVTELSSTELRRLLMLHCGDDYLAPGVLPYILENGLYGTAEDLRLLPEDRLEETVKLLLKPNRVAHVLGCRDAAEALAKRWGADVTLARRAGLLHDVTKALTFPQNQALCRIYGVDESAYRFEIASTMHQFTGALVAERIFGECEAVADAIRYHTTGRPGMTLLEKVIYLGDYIEKNRDFPGVEDLRDLAFSDLDAAMKLGLTMTVELLKERGWEASPLTEQTLRSLV